MTTTDIHNFKKRLAKTEQLIENALISQTDKDMITSFRDQCFIDGLGEARISKYLLSIKVLADLIPAGLCDAPRPKIVSLLAGIERSEWSKWTKHDYKIALKKYLVFCGREDLVKIIKIRPVHNRKLPEELINTTDILNMLDARGSLQDHALSFVLWESGARIGELLGLRRRHVSFDQLGAVLMVDGKTGMRPIRIIESAPILDEWISEQSLLPGDRIFDLSYSAAAKRIKVLAKRAGIDKRIYPHLFRHSRATYLAGHLTEAQLCSFMGWEIGSPMARVYVHLAGWELDKALSNVPTVLSQYEDRITGVTPRAKTGQFRNGLSK